MAARLCSLAIGLTQANGVQQHEGNMEGRCVMKSNTKCFENESQRRNEKGNPIPAGKNQTLTKIERYMRKQGRGVALKRAAAPLFWHGRLYSKTAVPLIYYFGRNAKIHMKI